MTVTDCMTRRHPKPQRAGGVVYPWPTCSLTIDVEDWYQSSVDFDAPISDRVVRNMHTVRALLDECRVKTTFFVQGMVAQKFPRLVQDLLAEGHEIQSHGYSHRPLHGMAPQELRKELELGRKTLEDACGVRVTAFRAPDFSIRRENLWALDILAEFGFEVDSSIFPMATRRYGIDGWDLRPSRVRVSSGAEIVEAPVAVMTLGGMRLPVAGGGYFRLLPARLLHRALGSIAAERRPVILYCHPYEFNSTELNDYRGRVSPLLRLHQGLGRGAFADRVKHLLKTMPFGRLDEVLEDWMTTSSRVNGHRTAERGAPC